MPSGNRRLFVAIDVPQTHLEAVEGATAPLREQFPNARWAPLANQHITVKFLGSTPVEQRDAVASVCRSVAERHTRSQLSLGKIGAFPSSKRIRVLWIGLGDPEGLLTTVAGALDEGFTSLGYRAEKRGFTPHLTLARFREIVRVEALPDIDLPDLDPWLVDRLSLYRSHLSPRGATYELLEEYPLA